jgi:hypothetical protein
MRARQASTESLRAAKRTTGVKCVEIEDSPHSRQAPADALGDNILARGQKCPLTACDGITTIP